MKKIFSLILALSLIFSLGVPAFAADKLTTPNLDVSANSQLIETKYKDVGELMKSLGIMVGYTDGELHLARNITRAEFVTTVIRTLKYDFMLGASENKFVDVPNTHWAKDYISLANALGFVNGVGDNKFNPDANVTIVEAEAILLRILGYGDQAQKIGWPNGYTLYSSQLGLSENVDIVNKTVATRGHIAQLLANALDIPMWSYFNDSEKTILTEYMGYKKVEGTISDTALTDDSLEFNEVKIGKTTYTLSDNKAPSYIGDDIIGYKNEKGEVAFISVKENDNIFNSIDSITNKKIEIDDKTYTFAKDIEIFVNNKKSTASRLNPGNLVKVVLDKDEDVTAIYAYTFQKENVIVSEISEKYIKAKSYASNSSQYSIKDKRILVYKNGVFGNISLLAKDDVVSISSTSKGYFISAAKENTISGELESISSRGAKISGKTYDLAKEVTYSIDNNKTIKKATSISNLSILIGMDVVVTLNQNDEIVHVVSKSTEAITGIVVDTYTKKSDKYVEVFNLATEETDTYEYTSNTNKNNSVSFSSIRGLADGNIFLIELVSDKDEIKYIKEIDTTGELAVTEISGSSIRTTSGNYFISSDSTVVSVEDKDSISVVDWDEIKDSYVTNGVRVVLALENRSSYAEYVFITRGYQYIGTDIFYGVIEAVGRSIYGDFYDVYTINGNETITLKDNADRNLSVGDVISYRMNKDDYAIDVVALTPKYDEVEYVANDYIELKRLGNYYPVRSGVMVFDMIGSGRDLEDRIADISDIENGAAIKYIVNNKNEVVYIEIVRKEIPATMTVAVADGTHDTTTPVEFTFNTTANDTLNKFVNRAISFGDNSKISAIEVYDATTGSWKAFTKEALVSTIRVSNNTEKFRVSFSEAGTYSVTARLSEVGTNYTLSSVTGSVTVTDASYTVLFNGGENAEGVAPTQNAVVSQTVITLPENTFTKDGFVFVGWSDGKNTYNAGSEYTVTENVTFTAVWRELVSYTVSFTGGDNGTGDAPAAQTVLEGTKITLPTNTFTNTNETPTFVGWSDGDTTYDEGSEYIVSRDVTFVATWGTNNT